ncbi:MAG: LysE family translocator [Bacteroidetes bacterium]|nr:LysE family translocator [Bacteroidota bacterium]
MEIQLILSFIAASVLLTLMPGPDNIFVLTQSITRGAKTGIIISFGLVSGVLVHTAIAATGLSIVLMQSKMAYTVVLYAGAAYLVYLAFMATKEKAVNLENGNVEYSTLNKVKLVRVGFLMNVLNPKVTLFFVAFLPQFVTSDGWPLATQFSVLGSVFILQAFVIFSIIAALAGRLNAYLNDQRFWAITKWSKVVILLLLAIFLLL